MLKVLIRYTDNFDVAPVGPPNAENLIKASMLARDYSRAVGVVHASVYDIPADGGTGEPVTRFVNGKAEEAV